MNPAPRCEISHREPFLPYGAPRCMIHDHRSSWAALGFLSGGECETLPSDFPWKAETQASFRRALANPARCRVTLTRVLAGLDQAFDDFYGDLPVRPIGRDLEAEWLVIRDEVCRLNGWTSAEVERAIADAEGLSV